MKFAVALPSLLLVSISSFAQTFTHPLGASPGAALTVTTEVLQGETWVAAQDAEYAESLYDIESQISALQGYQDELKQRIPEIRTSRNTYRRNDGCLNTLGRETREICYAPFSNDPVTRENFERARALDVELDSAKAKADAVAKRIRDLERKAQPLRKKKEKLAQAQADEEARIRRELQAKARQEATSREADIKKEEELRRAQELLDQREEKRHATEVSDLRNQIKKRDVQSALSDLRLQQHQMGEAIRMIEEEYDKSLMGAYMQKKFAALLESDLLCKKTAECQSGKKTKLSEEELLKLFPNAPSAPKTSSSGGGTGTR